MRPTDHLKKTLLLLAILAALVPTSVAKAVCAFDGWRVEPMAACGMACCGGTATSSDARRSVAPATRSCRCETRVRAASAPDFPNQGPATFDLASPALVPSRVLLSAPPAPTVLRGSCPDAEPPRPRVGVSRSRRSRAPPLV